MEPSEYERIAELESSHFWYRGLRALLLGALRDHARPAGPGGRLKLLDAGCGPGGLLAALQPDSTATGLDLSPLALQLAGRAGCRRLVRGTVGALPFATGSFDAVVSADVLYHAAVADDAVALAELGRVLRPGGIVVLNLPAHRDLSGAHDRQVHTARRYEREDVRRIAAAAGLEVVHLAWWNALSFPVARLLRRGGAPSRADAPGARGVRPVAAADAAGAPTGVPPARSDVRALPGWLNAPLAAWLILEARLARSGRLPFGLSLFAVLRRPCPAPGPG